jgi:egghead protein (zeste-white 4 protein)
LTLEAHQLIYHVVVFIWLTYLPVAAISITRWIQNRTRYLRAQPPRQPNDPHLIFQITTRSSAASDVVPRGIHAIRRAAAAIAFTDYEVCVVTDDPQDPAHLADAGCEVVVVPRRYATPHGTIRKARALHYAVEHRRRRHANTDEAWIYHLDEESYVTVQTLLALLAFIREKGCLISEGPIAYPLKFAAASRLTALAESIRPFQCYDCVSQMRHPPPVHMHGSNLLVRADVEDAVGWDHGTSLAEDQLFGLRAYERYGEVFGWHGGVLLEQPPLTLRDHFQQRRRWVLGTLQNQEHLSPRLKLRTFLSVATYWFGFLSALASAAMYAYYLLPEALAFLAGLVGVAYVKPEVPPMPIMTTDSLIRMLRQGADLTLTWDSLLSTALGAALLLALLIWLLSYQIGLFWNLRFAGIRGVKRLSLHLQQLLLGPLIGLVETYPAFYAVVEFYLLRRHQVQDFHVITK